MPTTAPQKMPHSRLGCLHEAQNVHRDCIDIQFCIQVAIVVPRTGTDDDQVDTTEFVEDFVEDRRGIVVRHIQATHDGFWRECLPHGFKSIKPAGQQP